MADARIRQANELWAKGYGFATAVWLLSRLVIAIAMLLIAPMLAAPTEGVVPTFGWGVFSAWDTLHYQQIATVGYEANSPSLAFFPFFPLVIRGIMALGLPFEIAGTLINNVAFLGALIVLFNWVKERHGLSVAQWATAVLAWCPPSLFGTVIYSEGLFLLLSAACLQAFERKQYYGVALWGGACHGNSANGYRAYPRATHRGWEGKEVPDRLSC